MGFTGQGVGGAPQIRSGVSGVDDIQHQGMPRQIGNQLLLQRLGFLAECRPMLDMVPSRRATRFTWWRMASVLPLDRMQFLFYRRCDHLGAVRSVQQSGYGRIRDASIRRNGIRPVTTASFFFPRFCPLPKCTGESRATAGPWAPLCRRRGPPESWHLAPVRVNRPGGHRTPVPQPRPPQHWPPMGGR
jgi:hypothetical protein